MEEIQLILDNARQEMDAAIKHLEHAFLKIRAGRASTAMVQDVMVEYYGSPTPLNQVANVSIPDAMTIAIQPWDRSAIKDIEKGIINSNLGFAPSNNGDTIILNVPPLTEERRKDLAKQAKAEAEQTKVTVRNARQDAMKDLKKLDGVSEDIIKDTENEVQQLTDKYISTIDDHYKHKEVDIMKI
ncbi:ribosome recycling factor [Riemerella anatipestifer]|uniref:Ribosome-recycling factor n=1 Tax=Riemerella anatipestifer (strain ATCC 11845 / DSM 15868 / JCM 9532 / NCTC 11014) TaxID=693978 RepID=E4TED5_RIEAD|nr:ribosome recycling factor [Riemerella anatipestifer]ADQ83144.1 ribosome recycling factor [Riemerella anatipestifer ATCC 11845 = DSM 15868]ADZ11341.1 Ribosome recycling factor [Riemerella anatipestifer RA-GD]AFD55205.1 ribosome recycling factor [Riemerella anatipestifer ATCC 11845 = DSM 15868]AGC40943.1 Ribosome recycling factor [Riemerella anatipestifer RA-CH-2]AKP70292.1 ribosome recycling factor [Riemerella anatipestifer]